MKIRLIMQSTKYGDEEYVHFSEDFKADFEDFKIGLCTIDFDKVIEMDEVLGFPTGYDLKRM